MVRVTLLTALALSIASSAQAKPVVNTPVIPSAIAGADNATCQVLNAGTKTATVTVEIFNANVGTLLASTAPVPLPPGIQRTLSMGGGSGGFTKFCRVTGLSKSNVTISFTEFDASSKPLMTVTAP